MTTRHTFSAHAALIPLLHAARFPHETVIGCLLGPAAAVASTTTDDNEREILYEHAIPLLHHWTGLSPAIEMAMTFVSVGSMARINLPQLIKKHPLSSSVHIYVTTRTCRSKNTPL